MLQIRRRQQQQQWKIRKDKSSVYKHTHTQSTNCVEKCKTSPPAEAAELRWQSKSIVANANQSTVLLLLLLCTLETTTTAIIIIITTIILKEDISSVQ